MPKRFLAYSRTQPARTIIAVAAIITFFAGLFIFTPWFVISAGAPAASVTFQWPVYLAAVINAIVCIPALRGIKKNTPKHIAQGAFWLFCWYVFVTLTRLLLGNPLTLLWVPTLIIAVILSVIYIEQSHVARRERGD